MSEKSMEAIFADQKVADMQRTLSLVKTQIRNALSEYEEDEDPDALIETLYALIGGK